MGVAAANLDDCLETFAARHGQVRDHQVDWLCGQDVQRLVAIFSLKEPVAMSPKSGFERMSNESFIVDDENRHEGIFHL